MKMIFLLFGIIAFSAASAQQKDVFDIHKYLRKVNELNRKLIVDDLFIRGENRCWGSPNLSLSKKGLQLLTERSKAKILTALINNNKAVYSIPPIRYINRHINPTYY